MLDLVGCAAFFASRRCLNDATFRTSASLPSFVVRTLARRLMLLTINPFPTKERSEPSGHAGPRARHRIALPMGSPLRQAINLAVLDAVENEWWQQTVFQYLGRR
jgi:hypothetical protein